MTEYGPLAGLVASVVALLSAGAAITMAWMRGADWAPPEEDVPAGPAKVAALLATIAIVALWFETGKRLTSSDLKSIAIVCGIVALAVLLIYSFLMGVFIYHREVAVDHVKTERRRVVGGLWLTKDAKRQLRKAKTQQRLLAGSGYDLDLVWPRTSRSVVKNLLIVSYVGLQLSGSIAIASIALSIDPAASEAPPTPGTA